MAAPSHQNTQITDAVTQAPTKVVSTEPITAIGRLAPVAIAQGLANAAQNIPPFQNPSTAQPASVQDIMSLYAIDTAAAKLADMTAMLETARPPKSPTEP